MKAGNGKQQDELSGWQNRKKRKWFLFKYHTELMSTAWISRICSYFLWAGAMKATRPSWYHLIWINLFYLQHRDCSPNHSEVIQSNLITLLAPNPAGNQANQNMEHSLVALPLRAPSKPKQTTQLKTTTCRMLSQGGRGWDQLHHLWYPIMHSTYILVLRTLLRHQRPFLLLHLLLILIVLFSLTSWNLNAPKTQHRTRCGGGKQVLKGRKVREYTFDSNDREDL